MSFLARLKRAENQGLGVSAPGPLQFSMAIFLYSRTSLTSADLLTALSSSSLDPYDVMPATRQFLPFENIFKFNGRKHQLTGIF
jgi:hypothetical protein